MLVPSSPNSWPGDQTGYVLRTVKLAAPPEGYESLPHMGFRTSFSTQPEGKIDQPRKTYATRCIPSLLHTLMTLTMSNHGYSNDSALVLL
jgi:hypothetical protein